MGKTLAWHEDNVSNMAFRRVPAVLVGVTNEILGTRFLDA